MAVSLTERDVARVRGVLRGLLRRAEADGCVLCDAAGYVLGVEGREDADPAVLSALGAGVFAASRELARLLGESEFGAVLHQGERRSLFIRAVTADALLVILFTGAAAVGLVRLYAAPAAVELRRVLEDAARGAAEVPHPERSFVLARDGRDLFGRPAADGAGGGG